MFKNENKKRNESENRPHKSWRSGTGARLVPVDVEL